LEQSAPRYVPPDCTRSFVRGHTAEGSGAGNGCSKPFAIARRAANTACRLACIELHRSTSAVHAKHVALPVFPIQSTFAAPNVARNGLPSQRATAVCDGRADQIVEPGIDFTPTRAETRCALQGRTSLFPSATPRLDDRPQ
jgi:hypothetical protein